MMARRAVEEIHNGRDPLVSLVMCVWRSRQDWLMQAVRSALGQRGCRTELIVVDDGSPEPVAGLLRSVGDPRLRIIRIPHGGLSRARNAGIAAARGDLLRFIDDDDVLDADSTARLLQLTNGDDRVIAYGATMFCDANLRPQCKRGSRLRGSAVTACLLGGFDVRIQAVLFPRRIVDAAGGWDPEIPVCQDWDFTLRALEHGRVQGDGRVALFYRRHPGSNSSDMAAVWRGAHQVTRSYLTRHPEARGTRLEARVQAMLDVHKAGWDTGGGPWKSGRFWRAVLIDPRAAIPALKRHLPGAVRRALRAVAVWTLTPPVHRWLRDRRRGREYAPPPGWVRFGALRRVTPLSRAFGRDRGNPVDRYYIERFLAACAADIRGQVLEVGGDSYTRRFGADRVTHSEVVDINADNPKVTIVADLTRAGEIPANAYDCVILTQTLQFIYDVRAALTTLYNALRPDGVLLATCGGISQISRWDADRTGHYWNFTTASLRRLFEEVFPPTAVRVDAYGNVLSSVALLHGMASEELRRTELEYRDRDYELVITVRAVKPR